MDILASAHIWLAQTYGSGTYNSQTYGSSTNLQIGPITLPVTGAQALTAAAFALIIALGVFFIATARRRKAQPDS